MLSDYEKKVLAVRSMLNMVEVEMTALEGYLGLREGDAIPDFAIEQAVELRENIARLRRAVDRL